MQGVENKTVAVLGAGSWGLAAALALERAGQRVRIWGHRAETIDSLRTKRSSPKLPNITLPRSFTFSSEMSEVILDADAVLFVTPAQTTAAVARAAAEFVSSDQRLIELSKGIEKGSLRRMTEVLLAEIPQARPEQVVALSGPSHAEEVAREAPTSVVAASVSEASAVWTQELFSSPSLRVYRSDDVIGVEIGGAVKNIIAIAAGIAQALQLGDNTLGALVTRGLAEISRLGVKLGANPLTFAGLSGLGDLITTCFSRHSRNRRLGELVGQGTPLEAARESLGMVAEGVDTCVSVRDLALREGVETPITEQVYLTLFEAKDPREALRELMGRELKEEIWT
ncbi:MAG TPA: NAD(P)H-dependent glycerol-3-phosphate dehydrogenase [candidate division Zixibacteria bacterium]|nr:NAD(P)H-dependent glycerol-3-phosphate dehydrogenase [candidate division Zixibacteria bacterium]